MKSMILILTSALLLLLLSSSSLGEATNPSYLACKNPTNYTCGGTNYNISFPFWVPGMDNSCSHPDFHLSCNIDDSKLIIKIASKDNDYQVKNIDYDNRVLTVVNLVQVQCLTSFSNTTLDLTPFEFADADANLTVYVNCSVDLLLSAEYASLFRYISCPTGQNLYYSVDPEKAGVEGFSEKCDVAVIPMNRTAVESLEAGKLEFAKALEMGFGVTWPVGKDLCMRCINSGGVCPTCFCLNSNSTNGSCPKALYKRGDSRWRKLYPLEQFKRERYRTPLWCDRWSLKGLPDRREIHKTL